MNSSKLVTGDMGHRGAGEPSSPALFEVRLVGQQQGGVRHLCSLQSPGWDLSLSTRSAPWESACYPDPQGIRCPLKEEEGWWGIGVLDSH